MKKLLIITLACIAYVAVFMIPELSAKDAPTEAITMMVIDGATATKPTVSFPHAPHGALECTACHHTWDGKAEIQKCKASGCHDDMTTKKGEKAYYIAYHKKGKQSCLGCHKALKKEKAPSYGPTACKQCHVE